MKPRILFVLISIAFFTKGYSQSTLSGRVVDAQNNNPLAGATIRIGNNDITTTDQSGSFTVPCTGTFRLSVSFIGFETKNETIKDCNTITVALTSNAGKLNEVEVSTTANPNTMLNEPVSITRLEQRELKRGQGLFMYDAINQNVPGVTMQTRTVSAGQQFNIRGYGNGVRGTNGLNSNFDGQGYKVYLNGIPVTDAEGITIMDDIDFASIGNVEIVKGPAGSLYGLAIAGAVNLTTIQPEKGKTIIGQDIMIGNYGLQRYTTHFQTASERSSLLVNYGNQKVDGFMLHTASKKDFINLAATFQASSKQSINGYFGFSRSYDERGGELTINQYNNKDYTGNPDYIKRNAHSEYTSFRSGLSHLYKFSNSISNTTTVFGTGVSNNVSSAGGWTDRNPINYGLRSSMNFNFQLNNKITLTGIAGVETQHQRNQTIAYNMAPDPNNANAYWVIDTMRSNQLTYSGTTSLFTDWTITFPHDLSVTAGLGYSNMNIRLNDRFFVRNGARPKTYDTSYTGMFAPHFAINKVFNKHLSVYASYSRGYKAPVSSYFFIPATGRINPGLKPEVGDQFEIGTKGVLLNNRFNYQLALFNAIFSDKMYAVAVPLNANTTAYSYISNGGKQNNKGVEALVKYTAFQSGTSFLKTIEPFSNLTYSDFKYDGYFFERLNSTRTGVNKEDYSGKAVAGVPKLIVNTGFDLTTKPGIYANAVYTYRDVMPITSDGANYATSYNLVNAKLGFQHSAGTHFDFDLYFGVNNITNTQYPLMVFVNQLPDAYMPAPLKANYFGGINLKYKL